MTPSDLFDQAFKHHQAGRLGDAERLYRDILAADADHIHALHMLGLIAHQAGQHDSAAGLMGRSLAIDGNQPACHYNLGVVLQALGRNEDALNAYAAALKLAPSYADAHNNLGTVLQALGRLEEAAARYRTAIRLKPNYPDALQSLGSALLRLGMDLQRLGRPAEAAERYDEAIRLRPDHAEALAQRLYCLRQLCDWRETGRIEAALTRQNEMFSPFMPLIFDSPPDWHLAIARRWAAQHAAIQPLPKSPRAGAPKIRLGYLSADFRDHPVGRLIADLIERHDRGRFEIIGYSYGADDGGALRQRLAAGFDRFEDISGLSDEEAARLIRGDGVDVLVDLAGYTANARTEILAYRPAPAQVNFLGYPGTMGADFIDYIIADPICLPPEDEAFFSEKVVRLADCYLPGDSQRRMAEEIPPRTEQGFVFCCFNNSYKITPALFAVWMRLLSGVPGSVLWLSDTSQAAKDNLRREAAAAGVAPDRIVFAPRVSLPEHLARHRQADLFLDTLPYNAHATASDALWAGLPVLTCRGKSFAGRVAASLLSAVGMEELIAESPAEYEALAMSLATDPARLAALKAKLAAAPPFDGERFAREIEAAYERMLD